jgi:electron transport complex protein RnfD
MQWVLLATLPGIVVLTAAFGLGTLNNIVLACIFALLLEAITLKLMARPVKTQLSDYSAIVTAVLLGIALPPFSAWWVIFCRYLLCDCCCQTTLRRPWLQSI